MRLLQVKEHGFFEISFLTPLSLSIFSLIGMLSHTNTNITAPTHTHWTYIPVLQ